VRDCNQCGKCCTLYGGGDLSVEDSDIERWETDRPDIAEYVSGGRIWFEPGTGRQLLRCPWLYRIEGSGKYGCRIYLDRPADCRHYPVTIEQMVRDDCEMLDSHDLRDLNRAQRQLDLLMADSRPPLERR
jgi:Fe-S-cluster containining protein